MKRDNFSFLLYTALKFTHMDNTCVTLIIFLHKHNCSLKKHDMLFYIEKHLIFFLLFSAFLNLYSSSIKLLSCEGILNCSLRGLALIANEQTYIINMLPTAKNCDDIVYDVFDPSIVS